MNHICKMQVTRVFFRHLINIRDAIKDHAGQSTIEFIFSFSFVILILMLCVRVTISMTNGFLVQLAVFQASRAYLVADKNSNSLSGWDEEAKRAANAVFKKYMSGKVTPDTLEFQDAGDGNAFLPAFIGPFYIYDDEQFTSSDLMGGGGPDKKLKLISESFLGKEPTKYDCLKAIFERIGEIVSDVKKDLITSTDDGC